MFSILFVLTLSAFVYREIRHRKNYTMLHKAYNDKFYESIQLLKYNTKKLSVFSRDLVSRKVEQEIGLSLCKLNLMFDIYSLVFNKKVNVAATEDLNLVAVESEEIVEIENAVKMIYHEAVCHYYSLSDSEALEQSSAFKSLNDYYDNFINIINVEEPKIKEQLINLI